MFRNNLGLLLLSWCLLSILPGSYSDLRFYNRFNCSRYTPLEPYDISRFVGVWNYVRLFSEDVIRAKLNCMRIHSTINKSTVFMNITIPHPEKSSKLMSSLVFGALDSKMENKAQWVFFSQSPFAPSKWIILAQQELHALYLICGDFPDGTSAVGEIGILSRETELTGEVMVGFEDILAQYDLDVTLSPVLHKDCPPLALDTLREFNFN